MPRRSKRFGFLEKALKAAGGTPSSGILAEYARFKAGVNKVNAGTIPPTARKSVGYAILPFGVDYVPEQGASGQLQKIKISVFSNEWRTLAGLSNANLGYSSVNYRIAQSGGGFYPATAKIFVASGMPITAISGITKQSYKRKPGRNYSIPFGAAIADVNKNSEFEQQAAITDTLVSQIGSGTNGGCISFLPEQLNKTRAEPPVGQ